MGEANRKREVRGSHMLTECPLTAGEQNAEVLLDYVSRRLGPELTEVFERHASMCAACQAFIETQSEVWNALDGFEAMPVSADFDGKLWARIEQAESKPWWRRLLPVQAEWWKPAIPVAAMALVMVGLWMRPSETGSMLPVTKAEVSIDAEQIDRTLEDLEMLRELDLGEAGARSM